MVKQLTAIIEKEDDGYVALCPEINIANQGDTVGEAGANLKEVLELFFLKLLHKKKFIQDSVVKCM